MTKFSCGKKFYVAHAIHPVELEPFLYDYMLTVPGKPARMFDIRRFDSDSENLFFEKTIITGNFKTDRLAVCRRLTKITYLEFCEQYPETVKPIMFEADDIVQLGQFENENNVPAYNDFANRLINLLHPFPGEGSQHTFFLELIRNIHPGDTNLWFILDQKAWSAADDNRWLKECIEITVKRHQ